MIVVDASVLANAVGDDEAAGQLARARLVAASAVSTSDLVDVETVSVLRRRWLAGDLSDERFRGAVDDLLALSITRFPVGPMMVRAFGLRVNITAYDACYVALAKPPSPDHRRQAAGERPDDDLHDRSSSALTLPLVPSRGVRLSRAIQPFITPAVQRWTCVSGQTSYTADLTVPSGDRPFE